MKNYIKKIIDCKFNIPNFVSELGKDLIKRILVTNPNLRFNVNQIKNHPWFYLYRKNGRNLVYEGLINTIVIPIEYDVNLTDTLICLLKFRNLNAAKKHFAFIFTDGLFSNLGEKEHIKNYIPQIEESGVSLFGIGIDDEIPITILDKVNETNILKIDYPRHNKNINTFNHDNEYNNSQTKSNTI